MYIGAIKDRIQMRVTLKAEYEYETRFAYRTTTMHIYKMEDENGNVLIWKTASMLMHEWVEDDGTLDEYFVNKGDVIEIKGTVKEHSEYRGEEQTVLNRVKVLDVIHKEPTEEEIIEAKRSEQIVSLEAGDEIITMPYRQYKSHYEDCETLAGSYDSKTTTIDVIVRNGRMKPSGVRGKRFAHYVFRNEDGRARTYYAVEAENAWKRLNKDFGSEDGWKLDDVIWSGTTRLW